MIQTAEQLVVEGLQIQMSSDEIRSHLENRARYHKTKAGVYGQQVESLRQIVLDDNHGDEQATMSNNPLQSLVLSQSSHQKKADYYSLLAAHVIADAIYRLEEHDLERLEYFSRF